MVVTIAAIIGLAITGAFIAQSLIPPVKRSMDASFNRQWPNRLPPIPESLEMRRRGLITEEVFKAYLENEGFSESRSAKLWEGSKTLLSAEALLILNWRKEITDEQFNEDMTKLGYDASATAHFKTSRLFYPSPSDLVAWQAREVFEPEAIAKYGLEDELEKIDKEPFYKAGMNDEQIRNYWLAHWMHPSMTMIFELLHRGLMEESEVFDYYRLVEIPPFWREKLTEISYKPFTRVDVRRMYETGVLSREQVKQSYLDLGYNDEKAESMTEFTTVYSQTKERDLSRTMIERAYEIGIVDGKEAVALFQELGYDEQESLLILALKTYSLMQDELDDKISTVKSRYRRGFLSQEEAIMELDKLEISASYRDKVIAEIQRVKQTEFQLPSKTDLLSFYKQEIIDDTQFTDYMERLGFQETEITLYMELIKA